MDIKVLERRITGKMSAIKRGELTMADSKVGVLFNKLKTLDEASYIRFIAKYKELITK